MRKRKEELGLLFYRERRGRGYSRKDLAKKLGYTYDMIYKIEKGIKCLDVFEIIDYCGELKISLTEFAQKIERYFYGINILPIPRNNILKIQIRVDVSWHENHFLASIDKIPSGTMEFTAYKFADLQLNLNKGFAAYINELGSYGENIPYWFEKKDYVFEYKFLDVQALLRAYTPYISLAAISRIAKMNENLLSQYLSGCKNARPRQMKRILDAIHLIGMEVQQSVL